ncbi:CyaA/EF/ExoY family adenylyl cyclase toxin [Cedecea neteri]|uniref:CyaA/EF/ExoY family adenylyl cyclase toxin n=1 Tax=Cedecea neteri TaxID=158822 RepID=UPI000AA6A0F4|nr:CyaA/EF/ExoY family adenylyl cyclase toxin [Cedecea neteri]
MFRVMLPRPPFPGRSLNGLLFIAGSLAVKMKVESTPVAYRHAGLHLPAENKIPGTSLQQLVSQVKDKTGIVPAHLIPLQRVASEHNCIIGIRPVDKLATALIEAGHPTKGFHIKGKSASWGPQAGFICVEQSFSKLENASPERIAKFNLQTQACIAEGHAVAVPLEVSQSRLHNLFEHGLIDKLSPENTRGVSHLRASGPGGERYAFEAQRLPGNGEARYRISHHGTPLEVLAPHAEARPFTADYDLMVIAPHVSELGPEDNLQVPDVSHQVFRQRLENYRTLPEHAALRGDYDDPASFYRKSDGEIGNTSERARRMIGVLNQALAGEGEKVVHHATDNANPVTDPESNYPATFALPCKIGRFEPLCIIENKDDLAELVMQAKNAGYHVPLNPLWEKEVLGVRSDRFTAAKLTLEAAQLARPVRQR